MNETVKKINSFFFFQFFQLLPLALTGPSSATLRRERNEWTSSTVNGGAEGGWVKDSGLECRETEILVWCGLSDDRGLTDELGPSHVVGGLASDSWHGTAGTAQAAQPDLAIFHDLFFFLLLLHIFFWSNKGSGKNFEKVYSLEIVWEPLWVSSAVKCNFPSLKPQKRIQIENERVKFQPFVPKLIWEM